MRTTEFVGSLFRYSVKFEYIFIIRNGARIGPGWMCVSLHTAQQCYRATCPKADVIGNFYIMNNYLIGIKNNSTIHMCVCVSCCVLQIPQPTTNIILVPIIIWGFVRYHHLEGFGEFNLRLGSQLNRFNNSNRIVASYARHYSRESL